MNLQGNLNKTAIDKVVAFDARAAQLSHYRIVRELLNAPIAWDNMSDAQRHRFIEDLQANAAGVNPQIWATLSDAEKRAEIESWNSDESINEATEEIE